MFKVQLLHNGEVVPGKLADLASRHTMVWVDIEAPTSLELDQISAHVGVETLELQNLLNKNQRPILQDIGEFTSIVFSGPEIGKNSMTFRSYLIFASKEQKDFITIHPGPSLAVQKIIHYPVRRQVELFQKGATALLFALLSEVVEGSFAVLDFFSEEISRLEEQVFEPKIASSVMKRIFRLKKDLIYFQRALSSDREVISEIEKAYGQFLDRKQISEFRLLYADVTQLIELSATYRDIIISAVEVHLSAISNNLNVIMKKLTAWAAIILVPSLIAGVYGMNFQVLPLASHPGGFWIMLGLMVVSVVTLYSYFQRNDWI